MKQSSSHQNVIALLSCLDALSDHSVQVSFCMKDLEEVVEDSKKGQEKQRKRGQLERLSLKRKKNLSLKLKSVGACLQSCPLF